MPEIRRRPLILALAALVITGCGASSGLAPADSAVAEPSTKLGASAPTGEEASAPAPSGTAAVVLTQAWATAPLTDVATGEVFRIADLAGSVVIVEPMAIWCSNCRAQQRDVQDALAELPADGVVYVVLDVDPNEDAASLAGYQEDNGFEGRYAIAGPDVARALAAEFGDQFLNPPSTPMLVVGTDGTVTQTEFGHKGVDELVALAEAHGA